MGEYFKENERYFTENPKKIDRMQNIKQIYAGFNCFFALSENKCLFGWGDNSQGQVSSIANKANISSPQSLRLIIGNTDYINVISSSNTTFLLSGQRAELEAGEEECKVQGKSVKYGVICGT